MRGTITQKAQTRSVESGHGLTTSCFDHGIVSKQLRAPCCCRWFLLVRSQQHGSCHFLRYQCACPREGLPVTASDRTQKGCQCRWLIRSLHAIMGDLGDIHGLDSHSRTRTDTTVTFEEPDFKHERATRNPIHIRKWWRFKMRGFDDDGERDWWFASTAIPLLASAIAPLANVVSIAALVTSWMMDISDGSGGIVSELNGRPFDDPNWAYWLNLASLVCGFVGNFFLLCNFTGRVRYIIALPATIISWYLATFILTGITISMHALDRPVAPFQVYTQGYWYAVMAAGERRLFHSALSI